MALGHCVNKELGECQRHLWGDILLVSQKPNVGVMRILILKKGFIGSKKQIGKLNRKKTKS